jgi:hypothetical protein
MRWSSARKGLCCAAAAYLALAVMGTFAFMSFDAPCFEDLAGRGAAQGVFVTSPAYPVECLAAGAAKDRSFSPPRQYLPRMELPVDFFASGAGLLRAAAGFTAGATAHTQKSAILLKLRI